MGELDPPRGGLDGPGWRCSSKCVGLALHDSGVFIESAHGRTHSPRTPRAVAIVGSARGRRA